MDEMPSQVEPMIPALRRYASGLLSDLGAAHDIVQDLSSVAKVHPIADSVSSQI